jgi:RHS repeat-associated protein
MRTHADMAKQRPVAKYLYDPFGNLLGKWGPLADANRNRFSSKEFQPNSGLYYYGFRFYEPGLQRWPNRDPLANGSFLTRYYDGKSEKQRRLAKEHSFKHAYLYVQNSPLTTIDANGLWGVKIGGVNFGYGEPNFDFDFDKGDFRDLKQTYNRNANYCYFFAWGSGNAAMFSPTPFTKTANLMLGEAYLGGLIGSAIGAGVSAAGEALSP